MVSFIKQFPGLNSLLTTITILSFKFSIYTIRSFDTNKSNNVLLSQIPTTVLAGSHHGVGAFLLYTFLFLNVVTTELWLVQAIHTGATVSSGAAGALTAGPELVLP